jgi:uncharacterized membrane protein
MGIILCIVRKVLQNVVFILRTLLKRGLATRNLILVMVGFGMGIKRVFGKQTGLMFDLNVKCKNRFTQQSNF